MGLFFFGVLDISVRTRRLLHVPFSGSPDMDDRLLELKRDTDLLPPAL